MKRILLCIAVATIPFMGMTQAQIENPGFEGAWEDVAGSEDEPEEWSSLKTADELTTLAPVVAFQETTDPHSGTYCLRLKNADAGFGIVANGLITNGRVDADLDPENGRVWTSVGDPEWEYEFTDKPDSLVCWIKYSPETDGGTTDKGKIEIILHDDTDEGELPESGATDHLVARARIDFTTEETSWIRVSAPFNYYNTNDPDYLLCVISAGDSTQAILDSELWIDDIELIYNPGGGSGIEESNGLDLNVYSANGIINVSTNILDNSEITVMSLDGKEVYNAPITELNSQFQPNVPAGVYLYTITVGTEVKTGKLRL